MLFEAVSTAITGLDLQQTADRPFRFGPFALCLVRPKQADEPIGIRLQALRDRPREAPKAPLRPRARRMRAVRGRRPVERPEFAAIAALALRNVGGGRPETVGRRRRGEPAMRARLRHGRSSCPSERPPGRIVAKQRTRWAPGHILCWLKPSWQLAEGVIEGVC